MSNKPPSTFFGRERQLSRLEAVLAQAMQGRLQLMLLEGESGTGKSVLAEEFADRAEYPHDDLLVAVALCDKHTGFSDPYMPFWELLNALAGDPENKQVNRRHGKSNQRLKEAVGWSMDLVKEIGPDLLMAIPTIGPIVSSTAKVAKVGWDRADMDRNVEKKIGSAADKLLSAAFDRGQFVPQYTSWLNALAKKRPLLLVIDDLHWADPASIELLFHIARQLQDSRIMIVGTYRPSDVMTGRDGKRHPFESMRNELKRYYGNIVINLDQVMREDSQAFIHDLVDSVSNRLGPDFRKKLLEKTEGNPLFAVELFAEMRLNGDLDRDPKGLWHETKRINWDRLPSRVEGIIEERIARLEQDLREILQVACVEGIEFHPEVISKINQVPELEVINKLSYELSKRYRLVEEGAYDPNQFGQTLSLYRFSHALFQDYLYDRLDKAQQAKLHSLIGRTLEAIVGINAGHVALQLSRHFKAGGDQTKACLYLKLAAERAMQLSAFGEARQLYEDALSLVEAFARMDNGLAIRAALLVGLGTALERLTNFDEALSYLGQGLTLAREAQQPRIASEALSEMAWVYIKQGNTAEAHTCATKALHVAESANDQPAMALAQRRLSSALRRQGHMDAAIQQSERALHIYRALNDSEGELASLNNLAHFASANNDHTTALKDYQLVLNIARQSGRKQFESLALGNLGEVARRMGKLEDADNYLHQSIKIARDVGDRELALTNSLNRGEVQEDRRLFSAAEGYYREALKEAVSLGVIPRALDAVVGLARISLQSPQVKAHMHAATWASFALNHTASDDEIRQQAQQILNVAQTMLQSHDYAKAVDLANAQSLDDLM